MSGHEEDEDFAALLAEFEGDLPGRKADPKVGDKVRGKIVSIGADAVFVDLGGKAEGALERDEVTDKDGQLKVVVGDTVSARVVNIDDRSGTVVLRTSLGRGPEAKAEIEQAFAHQIPVQGLVTGVNKGGVEVQVAGMRAFCPISQLDLRFVEEPEAYVGQKLTFRITKWEGGKFSNIVLSRRALLEEEQQKQAAETRAKLEVGAVLAGKVTALKDYGAFVDLGGLEGMVHVSELGLSRVERPADMLAVGQEVEVAVLKIEKTGDPRRPEKIGLSIRALERDPWLDVEQRFFEGATATGKVVRVEKYGAFVELTPGVEGLIHISELGGEKRLHHAREVLSVGESVKVRVLRLDLEQRRIGLSTKMEKTTSAEEAADLRAYMDRSTSMGTFGDLLKGSIKEKSSTGKKGK